MSQQRKTWIHNNQGMEANESQSFMSPPPNHRKSFQGGGNFQRGGRRGGMNNGNGNFKGGNRGSRGGRGSFRGNYRGGAGGQQW